MGAHGLVSPRDQRALAFLFAEWHDFEAAERGRRVQKLAQRLRAALGEDRSGYADDELFLFAVGAAVGARLPAAQMPRGLVEPDPVVPPLAPRSSDAVMRARRAPYWATAAVAVLLVVALVPLVALLRAAPIEPVVLTAYGPVEQPPAPSAFVRRVAVSLAVTNHTNALVFVSPLQFRAMDGEHRYYRANVDATLRVDAYRLVASGPGTGGAMAAVTLRNGDTVAGYVVFDVPLGARLTQIVLTAGNRELTVDVPADRYSFAVPTLATP